MALRKLTMALRKSFINVFSISGEMRKRAITGFKIGDKVKVKATYFDDDEAIAAGELAWSKKQYPKNWSTAYTFGIISQKLTDSEWSVNFSDGSAVCETSVMILVTPGPSNQLSKRTKVIYTAKEGDFENLEEEEQEEDGDVQDMPAGKLDAVPDGLVWSKGEAAPISDQRANFVDEVRQKARLNELPKRSLGGPSLFDMWLLWSDNERIAEVAAYIDGRGRHKFTNTWKTLTTGLFIRWLGLWHQMLADPIPGDRRSYWTNKKDYECFSRDRASFSEVMDIHQFEEIYCAFGVPPGDEEDSHYLVRTSIDHFNSHAVKIYGPGWLIVVDESMIAWTGRGMPGWIVVPRKPKPMGMECKTACCSETKIIIRLDVQEGKTQMRNQPFNVEWGTPNDPAKSVGCLLRLVLPWHHTGRVVLGDSWFGSVKAAIALLSYGMFAILNVKTATKYFPKASLAAAITKEKRTYSRMATITLANAPVSLNKTEFTIYAAAQREKKPLLLIATCETMGAGEPRHLTLYKMDENGGESKEMIEFPTTKVHGIYRACFNKIDLHNRVRQEFLHFADIWGTHSWSNRVLGELWGLILTNTYFTCQSFYPETFKGLHPQQFKEQIAWQMIQNPYLASEGVQRPISILTTAKHRMVRMPLRPNGKKNFTDTKCRYCKKNTTWYCATCSGEKHFFGICNNSVRGCWGSHTAGDMLPKRKMHRWKRNMVMEGAMVVHPGSN